MDNFIKSWNVLIVSILCVFSFYASAAFNIPDVPTIVSPMNSEVNVSVTPTLQAGELQLVDETGSMVGAGTLKQSQWLLTKTNEVALVGGNTLDNSQRDQAIGISVDVSSKGFSLSGDLAASVVVNSTRLVVKNATGEVLGYIELPAFIYQADVLDEFQAARVRFFQNGIVVQWHYGDAGAPQPWTLKAQAFFGNNELNIRFGEINFDAGFIANYGNELAKFCNKSSCYGHSLKAIYNTGNKAVCSLPNAVSNCEFIDLYSLASMDNMEFMAERNLISDSNQIAITEALEAGTQYYWRTRQAIDDGMGGNLYGDWSNFSGFTTVMGQVPTISSDIQVSIDAEGSYWGQKASSTFNITNIKAEALANITLKIEKPQNRKIISFPEHCTEAEMLIECVINSERSEEQLEIGYEFTESYSEKSYLYSVCVKEICGSQEYENFGSVQDLNELTSYSTELTSTVDLSGLIQPQTVPFVATIINTSAVAGQETLFKILAGPRVSVETAGCEVDSEYGTSIICINNLPPGGLMQIHFSVHLDPAEPNLGTFVNLEVPCEFGQCSNYVGDQIAQVNISVGSPESEGESSGGGGALLFLPALIALFRRRQFRS